MCQYLQEHVDYCSDESDSDYEYECSDDDITKQMINNIKTSNNDTNNEINEIDENKEEKIICNWKYKNIDVLTTINYFNDSISTKTKFNITNKTNKDKQFELFIDRIIDFYYKYKKYTNI